MGRIANHMLETNPSPEASFFVNEVMLADTSISWSEKSVEEINKPDGEEDNVRILVPLDLNRKAIIRRFNYLF